MFPRRKDGGKHREKAPKTHSYPADATDLPGGTRLKPPTDVANQMDPFLCRSFLLSDLRNQLLRNPDLYKQIPLTLLRILVSADDIFETLPFEMRTEISQFILDHDGAKPAILPHESPSATPRAPTSGPADLHHTPSVPPSKFCADVHTVGPKEHYRIKDVERERDELRAEVARLDAEKRSFIGDARVLLTTSESDDWQLDCDPYHQLLELAHIMKTSNEVISREMDTWIKEYNEEERQRATTLKDMKEIVQTATTQLNEQMEIFNQATENQAKLEAENQRLRQLLDTRAKEYQERRQSQEERHSATLQRLIKEHTAAMSEQMNVYEKELVDLRVAHGREVAEKPEYEEELDMLLESIKSLGRKHWRNSEGPRSQDEDC